MPFVSDSRLLETSVAHLPMFVLFFEDTLTLEYMNMETIREQRAQSSTVKTPKG